MLPSRRPALTRQILTFFVLAFSCAFAAAPARAPSVAVLDFTARGVSTELANSVSDSLSHALRDSGTFRVLDRNRISNWRDLSRGGGFLARCDQWNCAIRAGRIMQVDRVVIGSVEADDGLLVFRSQMIDVRREMMFDRLSIRSAIDSADSIEQRSRVFAERFARKQRAFAPVLRVTPSWLRKEERAAARMGDIAAGSAGIGAGLILFGAGNLYLKSVACGIAGDCSNETVTREKWMIGTGVALVIVALPMGVIALNRSFELKSRRDNLGRGSLFIPVWNPASNALGLATRLEF